MPMEKKKRGPKGKGGIRIIFHVWPQQLEAIKAYCAVDGSTRAEAIRSAINAYFFKQRRKVDRENRS